MSLFTTYKKLSSLTLGMIGGFGTSQTLLLPMIIELPISLGVGAAISIICYMVIRSGKTTKNIVIKSNSHGTLLEKARGKNATIYTFIININCQIFEKRIERITSIVDELILTLYDNHSDKIFDSRDFLGYYLDSIITILENYCKLSNVQEKIKKSKEIDSLLDSVYNAVKKKIESFDRANTRDLDIELTLLGNELKSKGF